MASSDFFLSDPAPEQASGAAAVPLFGVEMSFDWMNTAVGRASGDCCYHDVATCPDCSSGMIRLGSCFSCPVCGWGGCS